MTRITPNSGTLNIPELEDDEAYVGTLKMPKDGWFTEGSEQYGSEQRLTIDWEVGDSNVRDWIGLRLGKQQNGTVSKLRQLLNALSEKPRDAEINWFDDQTLEWSYDGKKAFDKIEEGRQVAFRGLNGKRQDGTAKFTIQRYAAVPKGGIKTKVKTSPPIDVDPNSIPF